MCTEIDERAQAVAMSNPAEALKVFQLSKSSSEHQLYMVFMREYERVNGGSADNAVSRSRVNAAVRDWKIDGVIEGWLARACVLAAKQVA